MEEKAAAACDVLLTQLLACRSSLATREQMRQKRDRVSERSDASLSFSSSLYYSLAPKRKRDREDACSLAVAGSARRQHNNNTNDDDDNETGQRGSASERDRKRERRWRQGKAGGMHPSTLEQRGREKEANG